MALLRASCVCPPRTVWGADQGPTARAQAGRRLHPGVELLSALAVTRAQAEQLVAAQRRLGAQEVAGGPPLPVALPAQPLRGSYVLVPRPHPVAGQAQPLLVARRVEAVVLDPPAGQGEEAEAGATLRLEDGSSAALAELSPWALPSLPPGEAADVLCELAHHHERAMGQGWSPPTRGEALVTALGMA
jgi:hypothetical protein